MSAAPAVVIAGGGVMGCSLAFHLLSDPDFSGRVLVVEKDPAYRLAASALSAASVRQQYSQPVNIAMSLFGIAFLREAAERLAVDGEGPQLGLVEPGYLHLATPEDAGRLRENHAVQARCGADIALLDPAALAERFPWLSTDGLALGALGLTGEGWFDGWALLQGLRRKARRLGAEFLVDEVVGAERSGDRVAAVRLRRAGRIACGHLANCAGSGGPALAAASGISIPVRAKRRSVFTFACRTTLPAAPLVIDAGGMWMRPDGPPSPSGQTFIAGWSPPAAADPDWRDDDPGSQGVDDELFADVVWPALAARVPAFAEIRPGRAWTGPYDMNLLDQNAILGRDPILANYLHCNGFSGHGLQHSPAVGRGLAELVVHGGYLSLDLSDLSPTRIAAGRPLRERNII